MRHAGDVVMHHILAESTKGPGKNKPERARRGLKKMRI
jgi:hypothetical protein